MRFRPSHNWRILVPVQPADLSSSSCCAAQILHSAAKSPGHAFDKPKLQLGMSSWATNCGNSSVNNSIANFSTSYNTNMRTRDIRWLAGRPAALAAGGAALGGCWLVVAPCSHAAHAGSHAEVPERRWAAGRLAAIWHHRTIAHPYVIDSPAGCDKVALLRHRGEGFSTWIKGARLANSEPRQH